MAIKVEGGNLELVKLVEEFLLGRGGCLVDYAIGVCGWEVLGVADGELLNEIKVKFKEDVAIVKGNMHSGNKVLCN